MGGEFMAFLLTFVIATATLFVAGCSSQSVLPETKDIKVSRKAPNDCKDLGKVSGRTLSAKGTPEEALEDMKKEAADKGATHVVVHQYSSNRTAVTGQAYQCN